VYNNLFTYIRHLELLAFFSGYPLIYYFIRFLAGTAALKNKGRALVKFLPFSYALVGSSYLALQLVTLYPDYSFENIRRHMQLPFLYIWGLLSILFWIPALAKKHILSLLHSLPFFFILLIDLFFQTTGNTTDHSLPRNAMNVYTISIILNLAAFVLILLSSLLILRKGEPNGRSLR
jgi:hypothetical protein